jgi:hypothetical protein
MTFSCCKITLPDSKFLIDMFGKFALFPDVIHNLSRVMILRHDKKTGRDSHQGRRSSIPKDVIGLKYEEH